MSGAQERALEPIQRAPLIDEVVVCVRELIDAKPYLPADRLPSERSLSEDFPVLGVKFSAHPSREKER
jgi:hypothetical protein